MNDSNTDPSQTDEQFTDELIEAPQEAKAERINPRELKDDAAKRAKTQPLVTRIMRAIKKEKKAYSELIINAEPLEKRVAQLKDGVLEKFEVERAGDAREVGAIFKGRIQNLEPGLKAAFVDIGQAKNAFLHYWDILPAANDNTIEVVRDNKSAKQRKRESEKVTIKDIPKLYPDRQRNCGADHKRTNRHERPTHDHQHCPARALPRAHALLGDDGHFT
jgi:ribonuclease G